MAVRPDMVANMPLAAFGPSPMPVRPESRGESAREGSGGRFRLVVMPGAAGGERPVWVVALMAAGYALFVMLIGLWLGGGQPLPAEAGGLPSPGAFVAWAIPVTQLARDACAILTVGMLLGAAVLVRSRGALAGPAARCVRAAGLWALGWAACAAFAVLLALADFVTVPLTGLGSVDGLAGLALSLAPTRAMLLTVAAALAVAVGGHLVRRREGAAALLGTAVLGLLPAAYAGHAATGDDHMVATSGMLVHTVAVALWIGGLAAIVFPLRGARAELPAAVTRFSAVALACFAATGVSGLAGAWVRTGGPAELFGSAYGVLVLGKIVLLGALGYIGWRHRSTTVAGLREGRTAWRPFLRLAAGEIMVMAAAAGLAVALSRTPPPVTAQDLSVARVLLGYDLPVLDPARLVTLWRPDPLILLSLAGAALAYAAGLRRLRGAGETWPRHRVLAWFCGVAVLAFALAGGVAAYAPALFSVHAVQHVMLGVVAPVLLVRGAPVTLATRVCGERAEACVRRLLPLTRPPVVLVAFAVPPVALYLGGLYEPAQSGHAVHLLAVLATLGSGLLFFGVVLGGAGGLDLGTRRLMARIAIPGVTLVALAVILGPPIAPEWFARLRLPWAPDPAVAQDAGGALWGLLTVTALLGLLALLAGRRRRGRRRARARFLP
ncbi:putative copper resistance protein D [Thermocatellispora tengchongensis]|uniref:Putative copper resistance protein D n=1 Tax=Thermocatellispora tengchongensis TaxID=1073253 RepID=A0A840PM38_9ACTN|nr:cytochrome c oxidase assembly protein [Thermocatellispora tengchongensis]MBB5139063.1 putative copper resistance protein D [Thermocatellispora tengchongensis]